MNIFYLHTDPTICAQRHYDKHVVKMCLETAQLLCTAHHVHNPTGEYITSLYRPTHKNHPSSVWVQQHSQHYNWAYKLFEALLGEYTFRYGKVHKCSRLLDILKQNPCPSETTPTQPPAVVGDHNQRDSVTESYKLLYKTDKAYLYAYTKRKPFFELEGA